GRVAQAVRDSAAHVQARREMAIQHRIARAERSRRTRVAPAARRFLQHAHLRAAGYEGHWLLDQRGKVPPAAELLPDEFPDRDAGAADGVGSERLDTGPGISLGGGRSRLDDRRSEEHTSELQSRSDLVCRLLLE